jgi:hypothetical protein
MLTLDRRLLFPHASRLRDLSRTRRVRLTWLGVALAAAVVVACWVTRRPAVVAQSDAHVMNHDAMLAIDHDTRTSWATPDGQPAALELVFRSARPVDALHLLPSDPPSNGYAIERAHVELFLEGRRVAAVAATFPKPRLGVVEWADVAVGASACDRVRVEVTSFYGKAGAISEVEVSP